MNSQVFLRACIDKNMEPSNFIEVVGKAMEREFGFITDVNLSNSLFSISITKK